MKYKLNEVVDLKIGRTPSRNEFQWFNQRSDDWKWVSIKDMGVSGKYISQTNDTISQEAQKIFRIPVVKAGTVILSFKLTVGRVAIAAIDLLTNEAIAQLPVRDNSLLLPEYLYYYLKAYPFETLGSTSSIATAVNSHYLKEMEIDVPSIERQAEIVAVLRPLDSKIQTNNRINDNLSKQAEAIFEGAFAESMYGDKKISDFILPKRGKPLLSKYAIAGDVPVVAGGLEPAAFHNVANTAAPVITISASGANAGFVRLWNIPVWSSDSSFIDKTMTDMVYFWYLVLKTRQDEIYGVQTGSAQPHVYPQNVGSLPINELDQVKAKEVNTLLTPLFEKIGENELENQKLASLRDSLLPRLLNGEINLAE